MRFTILTLFPGMITGFIDQSIIGRAIEAGHIAVDTLDIRDFAFDKHRVVDDYPYGGGAGMVMKPEPVVRAIESCVKADSTVLLMGPQGRLFDQALAADYSERNHLVLVCGHYEGIDERVSEFVHETVSVGDYVLTGGELAAAVVLDATARLVPGVLAPQSAGNESFVGGLLEGPQYTRPREFRGLSVPEVLLSGDHEKIRVWRRKQALASTLRKRPDLLANAALSEEDLGLLRGIRHE